MHKRTRTNALSVGRFFAAQFHRNTTAKKMLESSVIAIKNHAVSNDCDHVPHRWPLAREFAERVARGRMALRLPFTAVSRVFANADVAEIASGLVRGTQGKNPHRVRLART